jgi:hypothetical protein
MGYYGAFCEVSWPEKIRLQELIYKRVVTRPANGGGATPRSSSTVKKS